MMFQNFNTIDFIILGVLCLVNIACIVCVVLFVLKKNKKASVLDSPEEVKVVKVNESDNPPAAFDEIIEAMQKDLNSSKEDAVELFEQEQEQKAIISYQELLNAKTKKEKNNDNVNETENEVEIELASDTLKEEKVKSTPKLVTTKESKFTNSEFVSPVFGKMDKNLKSDVEALNEETFDPHELEKTLNIEPLADEIKKNNEFLNALKEFRKNL